MYDRTVKLIVDGKVETEYTVQGAVEAPTEHADAVHESVLFGSGDDFNGASALVDGVVAYVFDAVCFVYTCRRLIDLSALYIHAGD